MLPAVVTRNYIGIDDVKTWLKRGNSAVAKACFPLLFYVPRRLTGVKVRHIHVPIIHVPITHLNSLMTIEINALHLLIYVRLVSYT